MRPANVSAGDGSGAGLTSPSVVRELLRRHGIHLRRGLGQNFLVDANILRKVMDAAELAPESNVLEVGAGIGTLTQALAARASRVLVVELDRSLQPVLKETLSGLANVRVVYADVLQVDLGALLDEWPEGPGHVVANIPYQITSPLLVRLLELKHRFDSLVLMVQKEVARRLLARPAASDYGSMTVFVQYHTRARLVTTVSRNSFLPAPGVDSAVVRLDPWREPPVPVQDERMFFQVVHAAFGTRRKTLLNALSEGLARRRGEVLAALEAASIDPGRRGETLSLEEFARLANAMGAAGGGAQ